MAIEAASIPLYNTSCTRYKIPITSISIGESPCETNALPRVLLLYTQMSPHSGIASQPWCIFSKHPVKPSLTECHVLYTATTTAAELLPLYPVRDTRYQYLYSSSNNLKIPGLYPKFLRDQCASASAAAAATYQYRQPDHNQGWYPRSGPRSLD